MKQEYVDIIDENNNVINTVTRSEMRKNNLRHRTVYFMIFNPKGELLITKRTEMKDIDPGLYEVPGGTLKQGESYEENAYRELEEELGIKNIKLKFLFDFSYGDGNTREMSKIYSGIYDRKIKLQEKEIESCFFISIEKLKKMIQENKEKFPKNRIKIIEEYLRKE